MKHVNQYDDFVKRFGLEAAECFLERITSMLWNDERIRENIQIIDVHQINAVNHVVSGELTYQNESFGFIIESGDIVGMEIIAWGSPDEVGCYEPPPPTHYTFVPEDNLKITSPALFAVYLEWRKQKWFKEKEQGYNYDKHFAPGLKTEQYYRDWAKTKSMRIATSTEADVLCGK